MAGRRLRTDTEQNNGLEMKCLPHRASSRDCGVRRLLDYMPRFGKEGRELSISASNGGLAACDADRASLPCLPAGLGRCGRSEGARMRWERGIRR